MAIDLYYSAIDLSEQPPLFWCCGCCRGVVREWQSDGPTRRRAVCEIWCESDDGTVTQVATAKAFEDLPATGSRL